MSEMFFVPTRNAAPVLLTELKKRFDAEGVPCTLEEDSPETCWFVFEPHELTIYASTSNGQVTLATVNVGLNDDLRIFSAVERVLAAVGFSADEDADYV